MAITERKITYSKLLEIFTNMLTSKDIIFTTPDTPIIDDLRGHTMDVNVSTSGNTTIWGTFKVGKNVCLVEKIHGKKIKVVIFRVSASGKLEYVNKIESTYNYSRGSSGSKVVGTLAWEYNGKIYTNVKRNSRDTEHIGYDIQNNSFITHDVVKRLKADNEAIFRYENRIICFKYDYDDPSRTGYTAPSSLYAYVYDMSISNLVGGRVKLLSGVTGSIWGVSSNRNGKFAVVYLQHSSSSTYGNDFSSGLVTFDARTCTGGGRDLYIGSEEQSFLGLMYDCKAIANVNNRAYLYDGNTWTKTDITNRLSQHGGSNALWTAVSAVYGDREINIGDTIGITRHWVKVKYRNKKCILDVKYGYLLSIDYSIFKLVSLGTVLGFMYDESSPKKLYLYTYDSNSSIRYQKFDTWE